MGSLNSAMTSMRDLTSQLQALGRQRKMTGNMSLGENFEPAIYKGLYESALGKMVDFGNLDVSKQNADTNRFNADTNRMQAGWQHEYWQGSLSNDAQRNALYGQQIANDAAYQQGQLGLGYAQLGAQRDFQQGQLGIWGRQADIAQQQNDIDALYKAGLLTNDERRIALAELQTNAQIKNAGKQNDINQQGVYTALGGTALNAASQLGVAYLSQPKTTQITVSNVEAAPWSFDSISDEEISGYYQDEYDLMPEGGYSDQIIDSIE